jgi:site-specific DNA recombinase
MMNNTTKPDSLQPAAEKAVDLFDNWFDPIETEVRARAREFIEELIRGELDAVLARPRHGRLWTQLETQHPVIEPVSTQVGTGISNAETNSRTRPSAGRRPSTETRAGAKSPHSGGSVTRVSAADIEDTVLKSLEAHFAAQHDGSTSKALQLRDRETLVQSVTEIAVHTDKLVLQLRSDHLDDEPNRSDDPSLTIPWQKPPSKRSRRILLPHNASRRDVQPEQFGRRARLVSAIAKGRQWLDDVISGRVTTVQEICVREKCSARQVNMTISLAFLAPNLVKAAVEGRLPRGIGVERLRDPPPEWSRQFEALGLNPE